MHAAWRGQRMLYRLSRGRFLWTPRNRRGWGALYPTTTGRRSGQPRGVIVAYLEDGPGLLLLAMNGWDPGHPAWLLNLQADPAAVVRMPGGGERAVRSREAVGAERDRLWDYKHGENDSTITDENAEYVVPVEWTRTLPLSEAYWEKGMFANQNSACKLRQEFTLQRIAARFAISEDE